MKCKLLKRIITAVLGTAVAVSAMSFSVDMQQNTFTKAIAAESSSTKLTINDFPSDYQYAADWIWENRIKKENSTGRLNTIFDQIIAGKGTINYVVKWQSYKKVTLEQRQKFEKLVSDSINDWAKWLSGYENWPYDHIDVKIVGWAVIDESCILDRQPDEIIYTDTIPYDSQYDTVPDPVNNPVPDKEPLAPSEISRFDHFTDKNYEYPGGLDKRFDMYLWGTQGFPSIGGCGGDWGQRLSDDAYINMLDGTGLHVLEHELGHGFGMTDFYGGEGEANGFPPGGFPGGENSLMMAGSAMKITDFDGWMLRYMWTKLSQEEGRFDIPEVIEPSTEPTEPTTEPTEPTTEFITEPTEPTTQPTEPSIEPTETPEPTEPGKDTGKAEFTDTIISVTDSEITFAEHGTFKLEGNYYGTEEQKNLAHYEAGDKIYISLFYNMKNSEIIYVVEIKLIENVRDENILGDVNLDKSFNISDVLMLQKYLVGLGTIDSFENANCYNKDNAINIFDLVCMKGMLIEGQK